ncbi:MAG TPA: hypothetical protein VGA70_02120 [Longimicrobiales bacterium]|jgi:hypothetical protein
MFVERDPSHVRSVMGDDVEVHAATATDARLLRALGGRRGLLFRRTFIFRCPDQPSLAAPFVRLRDGGIAFATAPHGWPPGGIFEQLRDDGLLSGSFVEVCWTDEGVVVRDNPAPSEA